MPQRFPPWLKQRIPSSDQIMATRQLLAQQQLHTVCQSARCPNISECFAQKTATFMILGNTCTRNCRFCAVEGGQPQPVDPQEPQRVAEAAAALGLKHVVVTSVTRDDLADGGAGHFAAVVQALGQLPGKVIVEVLTPDFGGELSSLSQVLAAGPAIFNHNVETVPRLYQRVRPEADYQRSIKVLASAKEIRPGVYTKSGMMLGLGEQPDEVLAVMQQLREVNCDVVTLGQYLQPSARHLDVVEFIHPDQFEWYRQVGEQLGFMHVAAAPLVRSSYHASDFSAKILHHQD